MFQTGTNVRILIAGSRGILGCEVAGAMLGTPQSQRDAYTTCAPTEALDLLQRQVKGAQSGRVDVAETASISLSIAGRYAQALFDLAKEDGALKALESDADALGAVLTESPELAAMVASPVVNRKEQAAAIAAVADEMGLGVLAKNTLALMAQKHRLFVLPQLVQDLKSRIATEKGEVTADVTSAAVLTAGQRDALVATLKANFGKDVKLNTTVDESLIGGLIVKLGSTMIDTSVKAKLAALQNAMKEVG